MVLEISNHTVMSILKLTGSAPKTIYVLLPFDRGTSFTEIVKEYGIATSYQVYLPGPEDLLNIGYHFSPSY